MGGLKRIAVCGAAVPLCLLVFTACGGGGAAGPGKPGENSALDDYGAGGSAAKRVGSAMMKFVGGELASTAVGGAAGIAMDAALEAIFGNDTERIEAGMEECNQKLDQVIEKLDEISKQLDDALQAIAESRDDIEALNQELAIKEPIDIIQSDYRNLEQMSRWASDDDDSNDPTSADAKELADTIRSTAKHDIPLQLDRMHSGIVGDTGSGKGALKEWTDQIRNGVRNGDDLYDAYLTLENYFTELLTIQTKGMVLIANAYEMDDDDSSRYVGTAQSYRDEVFYPNVEEQLKQFLQYAERLIADKCAPNRQTFLVHGNIKDMYNRMDWIAAQCSEYWTEQHNGTKFAYGLHVHIWMDDNKVKPRSASPSWKDKPCQVYYGPAANNDQLSFDEAWAKERYDTQGYVDLMLLDDDPRVAGFDFAYKVRTYAYSRPEFETQKLHIQHELVAGVDWERDAKLKYYDVHFNEVSAGTEGAKPHCTVVVDYRIQEVPLIWKVSPHEGDTWADGWTIERLWPGDQAVYEVWCGLKGTPASGSSNSEGFSFRLDSTNDFFNAYDDKDILFEFEAKISKKSGTKSNKNPYHWLKYGWAKQVTTTNWQTYQQKMTGIKKNERFPPGVMIECTSHGKVSSGPGSPGTTAKAFEFEARVRKMRLYVP